MPDKEPLQSTKPQIDNLVKSSIVVSLMTSFSRILGMIRDIVIANFLGATSSADAFFIAFKIPNFLRRMFAEGAFSQAFVPTLTKYRSRCSFLEVRELIQNISGTLAGFLFMVTVLAIIAAPVIIRIFAPGFIDQPDKLALAEQMLRITFPYLMLISLSAFVSAVLNCYSQFAIPALTPSLLNISLIGATLWLSPYFQHPVVALAWGVLIAGIAQFFIQLPFLWRLNLLAAPKWNPKYKGVKEVLSLMLPALFSVSVSQINLMLDTILASLLQEGSVSWLYYADRLSEFPLGVFGIAIATVVLPNLAKEHAKDTTKRFSQTLDWALKLILLIGLPSALALFLLAEPLIATLFGYGKMSANDIIMSAKSLRAYAVGLPTFMLIKVLASAYFSRQNTKTPVAIGVKAMISNMFLNLILVVPLQHAGLALATSLSATLNAFLLYRGLIHTHIYHPSRGWLTYFIRLVIGASIMGLVIYLLNPDLNYWLNSPATTRAYNTAKLVIIGVVSYFSVLFLLGFRMRDFVKNNKEVA